MKKSNAACFAKKTDKTEVCYLHIAISIRFYGLHVLVSPNRQPIIQYSLNSLRYLHMYQVPLKSITHVPEN